MVENTGKSRLILIIAALAAAAGLFFIKEDTLRYSLFAAIFVLLGIDTTFEYTNEKKKAMLVFAVMFYGFFLLAVVFLIGTMLFD